MIREFDLNIETVLENWDVSHAIREIIANALDEQKLTNSKSVEIFCTNEHIWHIKDFGRGLQYVHLTQNENEEKLSHADLIGKFGVGLKDALATFDRHNIDVKIISKHGVITLGKTHKHGFEDVSTLHAYIDDGSDITFIGTEFIFDGCHLNDIKKAKEYFLLYQELDLLETTQLGQIFDPRGQSAEIYINGVKVASEENFLFSYNITSINAPIRRALNRERTNVGRSAYADRIKSILLLATADEVINKLTKNVGSFSQGSLRDELKWADVSAYAVRKLNEIEDVVFITPRQMENLSGDMRDIVEKTGKQIVFIPENVHEKVSQFIDDTETPIYTIQTVLDDYRDSFKYEFIPYTELSKFEKSIFDLARPITSSYDCKYLENKIAISKTIKPTVFGEEATGCWDPAENKIIILRNQLASEEDFLGTLIHELIHAHNGLSDVSRGFEHELTRIIGVLAGSTSRANITPVIAKDCVTNGSLSNLQKILSGYVSISNLFPPSFMSEYTSIDNIQNFFDRMPTPIRNQVEYDAISNSELDKYVLTHTPFISWRQMVSKAIPGHLKIKMDQVNSDTYIEPVLDTSRNGVDYIFEYINVHIDVQI